MLRVTELKMKLDHSDVELRAALARRLDVDEAALGGHSIARRGHDARRRAEISLIYTVDAVVADEAAVLRRHAGDRNVSPAPDARYRFVARVPEWLTGRPVVIGSGACRLLAALTLAQMGFRPIVLDCGG